MFSTRNKSNKELEELGVELFYGDLQNKQSLEQAVHGINVVYHLASEVYSMKSDQTYFSVNVLGTKNLIETCRKESIQKFIYLSSIAVVGPNLHKDVLLKETDICNPIVPYGKSKLEAETAVLDAFKQNKFPAVVIRPPIVYGPQQKSELTKIFRMIKTGKLKIIGDGNNLKSLCYIDNLIQGILLAEGKKGNEGEIYFIADAKPYSINEICQTVAQIEDIKPSALHLPAAIASISGFLFSVIHKLFKFSFLPLFTIKTMALSFACDIAKARSELGYIPAIDLKEGLKRTIDWYDHEVGSC